MVSLMISFPYDFTGVVMEIMEKSDSRIVGKRYSAETELTVRVKKSQCDDFKQLLLNKTGGKIFIKEEENEFS